MVFKMVVLSGDLDNDTGVKSGVYYTSVWPRTFKVKEEVLSKAKHDHV